MTLKLAFIGTGGIASAHLRGVAEVNQQRGASAERLYELVAFRLELMDGYLSAPSDRVNSGARQ